MNIIDLLVAHVILLTHPKLFNGFNYEPKGKNIRKRVLPKNNVCKKHLNELKIV
jgi:hypothetical protein